jgi:hypothetical protein
MPGTSPTSFAAARDVARILAVRASAAELEAIVGTARLLLNDQAAAVDEIRALGAWGAALANTVYVRAGTKNVAVVETVRKPEAPPAISRERPATVQPSAPEVAAGLHRPASAPPHRPPVRVMQAVPAPTPRPADLVVAVEHRGCDVGEGAS